jgi:hypothetical protein
MVVLIMFSGCRFVQKQSQEEMFVSAAAMKRLSAAVESSVRYKDVPEELRDYELLEKATENNPQLLKGFENFSLKAIIVNKHSIVLMCDAQGKLALIEDTGCTGEVDALHWQNDAPQPCDFTLDISAVCGK